MPVRVGINGFGRIGRNVLRAAKARTDAGTADIEWVEVATRGEVDRRSANGLQGHVIDLLCGGDLAVGVQVVVDGPDLDIARRQNQIAFVDGTNHVHDRQFMGIQFQWIDVDHDLAVTSAKGLRYGSTLNAGNLVAYVVLPQISQLGFVHPLPF